MSIKQGGVTIAGGSGTVTDMDNITITKNAYSKIQTVGQTNKNTATGAENYLYDWVGTLEEYNTQDIVTNHPEWICYITDDDIGSVINDSTITIKQGGITKGFFTLNQDTNKTISLDAGGGGGGGTVAIDEVTITENGENKIQASATRNANLSNTSTTSVFDWVGTYQEYSDQNIAVNHPTWICFITDDIEGGDTTNCVHKQWDETINGTKVFTSSLELKGVNAGNISTHSFREILFTDQQGTIDHRVAGVRGGKYGTDRTDEYKSARQAHLFVVDANNNNRDGFEVLYNEEENRTYTKAVSPKSSSNSNDVVTTEYENRFRSNCLINIPQDIKLELNNGTLTLKAGSKVYVPNGFEQDGTTPHFDTVIIENDMNTAYSNVGVLMLFWSSSFNYIFGYDISYCKSGSSVPASFTGWFYNTTTNTINQYQSGTIIPNRTVSLPLGLITTDSSSIKSIDQVFNGFGFMGQCTFTLPGVVGLIPNGRNTDGTLKNTILKSDNVIVHDLTGQTSKFGWFTNGTDGIGLYGWGVYNYIESDNDPILKSGTTHAAWYDTKNNLIKITNNGGSTWTLEQKIFISQLQKDSSSGNITAIETKKTIQVADQNDSFLRRFITVDKIVASGAGGIAGTYDLGFKDGKIKLGVFAGLLSLSQAGFSCLTIKSDVCDREVSLGATNNQFRNDSAATIPFINKITIGFSETSGGVSGAGVVFVGYL